MMTLVRGKGVMSSTISTYREEFRDPAEFEGEGKFPLRHVLQNGLRLVGRHILVGIRVVREAIGLLELVNALVAKNVDDEHESWDKAKEIVPELEASQAPYDHANDDLPDGKHREDSHEDQLLEQRDGL